MRSFQAVSQLARIRLLNYTVNIPETRVYVHWPNGALVTNQPPDDGRPPAARHGVVAVIVNLDRLLVIRRSQHVVAPGAFCFPGGGIESGESETDALVREIQEELGVQIKPVRALWQSTTPWNVCLTWWLVEAPRDCTWSANLAEVESIHWLTTAEIKALPGLLESNHEFLRALAGGEIRLEI
jgi:8-oxo-dGTP pyrophosphatase MutT (NUDIX family)